MPKKIDWNLFEQRVRATLRSYQKGELLGTQACRVIDEAMAAVTGRGNVLPQEPLEWESDADLRQIVRMRDGFWT